MVLFYWWFLSAKAIVRDVRRAMWYLANIKRAFPFICYPRVLRSESVHGRTAGEDGALLDVHQPDAGFHIPPPRGTSASVHARTLRPHAGSLSLQCVCNATLT